jgi:hypothetical protein
MNSVARATSFRFFERSKRRWELRLSRAEITGRLGLAVALINWGEDQDWSLHLHLGWPNVFLKLPFIPRREPKDSSMDRWGFSVCTDTWAGVHLNFGSATKIVHMPWAWEFVRRSVLMPDGRSWVHELADYRLRRSDVPIGTPTVDWWRIGDIERWKATLPYRYTLRSGQVQEREATIGVEEMEWRWRWFRWLPFPRMVRRSIDVSFNDEVGERSGSWKGGTIGCGYNMQRDETPEECLRRMENERKF